MPPQGEAEEEKKRLQPPREMGNNTPDFLATRRQILLGLLHLHGLLHATAQLVQILSQVHHQGVVIARGGPLAPFLLVNVWEEPHTPHPQERVTNKVQGPVEVGDCQAEARNQLRQLVGLSGNHEGMYHVAEPEHCKRIHVR